MRRRSSPSRPSKDQLAATKDEIARRTAGAPDGSLRIDPKLLDDGQARELVELTTAATALSSKERERWENLVEIAAGKPRYFGDLRDFDAIQQQGRELHRSLARRPFTRKEERGVFAELGEQVEGGFLRAEHVAVLTMLFIVFESGQPLGKRQVLERVNGEPVLRIDANWGLISDTFDDVGMFARFSPILAHLAANSWVTIERRGPEWSIRLGVRAKRALGGTKTKAAA